MVRWRAGLGLPVNQAQAFTNRILGSLGSRPESNVRSIEIDHTLEGLLVRSVLFEDEFVWFYYFGRCCTSG